SVGVLLPVLFWAHHDDVGLQLDDCVDVGALSPAHCTDTRHLAESRNANGLNVPREQCLCDGRDQAHDSKSHVHDDMTCRTVRRRMGDQWTTPRSHWSRTRRIVTACGRDAPITRMS